MDPKLQQLIAKKIDEFADAIEPESRDDFVQDMWVRMLTVELPDTGVASFLNLLLYRARFNWLERAGFDARWAEQRTTLSGEEQGHLPGADITVEAVEALRGLVASLQAGGFPEAEISLVVDGLLHGLTHSEIAASLERSPQNFQHHVNKFRAA